MLKVLSTEYLGIDDLTKRDVRVDKVISPERDGVDMLFAKDPINRALLSVVTTPNLRSLHTFKTTGFNEVTWSRFEPYGGQSIVEVRGTLSTAIKIAGSDNASMTSATPIKSGATKFIIDKRKVIRHLEELSKVHEPQVFIVVYFRDDLFVTGTHFCESSVCQALRDYEPQQCNNVISKEREVMTLEDTIEKIRLGRVF